MTHATRVLVVDDEPLARKLLVQMLERDPEVTLVGECGDGASAVAALRGERPEILFLDVQMPRLDGFGVLEEIGAQNLPAVVFVTASGAHALHAFDREAVDYLLKPFDEERFQRALDRAKVRVRNGRMQRAAEDLARLVEPKTAAAAAPASIAAPKYLERFVVETAGRLNFVPVDDVDWIEAQDYYVQLHAGGREHLIRESLRRLEERLDPRRFVRIHRSAMVNVLRVQELQPHFHGEYRVRLVDGTELRLSRTRRDQLQTLLGG